MAGGPMPRIRLNLAHSLAKRGEYAKAEEILRRLLVSDPTYVLARNNLADVMAHQGKKDKAEELLASTTEWPGKRAKNLSNMGGRIESCISV
jgi:Tfp pilus assembly protein PilF